MSELFDIYNLKEKLNSDTKIWETVYFYLKKYSDYDIYYQYLTNSIEDAKDKDEASKSNGILICFNNWQFWNTSFSIVLIDEWILTFVNGVDSKAFDFIISKESGSSICAKELQFEKQPNPILVTKLGRFIFINELHLLKQLSSIFVSEWGNSNVSNEEHSEKVDFSRIFNESGSFTSTNDLHSEKAEQPIDITEEGISIPVNEEHFKNAFEPI